eukprot:403370298
MWQTKPLLSSRGGGLINLLGKQIRNIDRFGHPISLTYKRDNTFKSTFGGIMTIFSLMALIAYLSIQLKIVINREQYTINNTNYVKDLYVDTREISFPLTSFDFATQLTYRGNDPAILADNLNTYFSVQFFDYYSFIKTNYTEGEFPQQVTLSYLPLAKCNYERFMNRTKDDITKWWCPQVQNWNLRGSIASGTRRFIAMKVTYCNQIILNMTYPGLTCKTTQQSDALANQMTVLIAELTQYFESASFADPIQYYIKSQSLYMGSDTKIMFFKLGKQVAYLKDAQFHQSFNQQNLSYTTFQFDYSDTRKRFDDSFINIYIYQDENVSTTTRQVFNFLDALSTSGGFSSIIMLFFAILTKRIQQQLYFITLLKKIFLYLNDQEVKVPQSKVNKQRRQSNLIQLSFQTNPNSLRDTPMKSTPKIQQYDVMQKQNSGFGVEQKFVSHRDIIRKKSTGNSSPVEKMKSLRDKRISEHLLLSDDSQTDRQFVKQSVLGQQESFRIQPEGNKNYQRKLQKLVEQRIKCSSEVEISARQYLLDRFISTLLCCFRRPLSKQQSLIKLGIQHLLKEFDMIRFLKKARIADSLGQITLTKFQRDLIPYLNNNILTTRSNIQKQNSNTLMRSSTMQYSTNLMNQANLPNQISQLFRDQKHAEQNQRLFENLVFEQEYIITESDQPPVLYKHDIQINQQSEKVKNKSSSKVKKIRAKTTNPISDYMTKDTPAQFKIIKDRKVKSKLENYNDQNHDPTPKSREKSKKKRQNNDHLNKSQD